MDIEVSVLVPNYNKGKYIYERLVSIKNQSYKKWELIIVDGFSDDGSWEIIKEFTKLINNPIQALQLPRKGIYDAINEGIKRASGKYIYIATSDDLMSEDCLSEMVAALQEFPDCGICSSCLNIIDEDGKEIENKWMGTNSSRYFGSLLSKKHVRYAPHDAIVQCFIYNVFTSLTQLLIRKNVFDTIGLFSSHYGSAGDFEWELRATLRFNTIHLPKYLSSWRVYPGQATNTRLFKSTEGQINFVTMIESVFKSNTELLEKHKINIDLRQLTYCNRFDILVNGFWEKAGYKNKFTYILSSLLSGPGYIILILYLKLTKNEFDRVNLAKKYILKLKLDSNIKIQ